MAKRRWLTVIAVVFSVLAIATPALAHYVYQSVVYARYGSICYHGRSEISHGSKSPYGGYWKTTSYEDQDFNNGIVTISCYSTVTVPAGYLAGAVQKEVWLSQLATPIWGFCGSSSGWKYNPTPNWAVDVIYDYGGKAAPCGNGYYYGNMATTTARDPTGATWIKPGGSYFTLWSGYHWLPA